MSDLIDREMAIYEILRLTRYDTVRSLYEATVADKHDDYKQGIMDAINVIVELASAQPEYMLRIHQDSIEWVQRDSAGRQLDAEFISWLLDEVWDEEMWELNCRAFPELLCRWLVKARWLKEEGGKYVRLDK